MEFISKKQTYILVGLFLVVLLLFNWSIGLWDQDEAAYAGFALRMNATGDYLIPDFPWSFIHRKPPLHFWFNAFWFEVFGPGEWATRFSSTLSIILSIVAIWKIGGKVFGEKIGRTAAVIGCASLYSVFLTKIAVTDADLMFFETLAILSLLWFVKKGNYWGLLLSFVGVSGGGLVKGPPVFVVAIGLLGVLFLFRQYRIRALIAGLPVLLGFLPLYIWGYIAWQSDGGEFVTWLIDWYILSRNKPFAVQTGPPGYFLIFFLLTFFSFSGLILTEFKNVFRALFKKDWNSDYILLLAWILPGWLLYEFIPSKLPTYAIACFGAVCVLIAKGLSGIHKSSDYKGLRIIGVALSLLLNLALVIAPWMLISMKLAIFSSLLGAVGIYLTLQTIGQYNLFKNGIVLLLFSFAVFGVVIPGLEDRRGVTKVVAETINEKKVSEVIITHNIQLPSLLFYLEEANTNYTLAYQPKDWSSNNVHYLFFSQNQKQLDEFLNQSTIPYSIDTITGWQYDRGKIIDLFILEPQ